MLGGCVSFLTPYQFVKTMVSWLEKRSHMKLATREYMGKKYYMIV
jgi:hypothetical protein